VTARKDNLPEALLILGVLALIFLWAAPWWIAVVFIIPVWSWSSQGDHEETRKALIETEKARAELLRAKTALIETKKEILTFRLHEEEKKARILGGV
jgi:hypothetical protein